MKSKQRINLKPCPFCGANEQVITTIKNLEECANFEDEICPAYEGCGDCGYYTVVCNVNNGGCGASSGWKPSEEAAIAEWNRRLVTKRWIEKGKAKKVVYEDVGYDQYHNENIFACICPSCGLEIIRFYDSDVENSESDEPKKMFHDCMVHHAYIGLNNFCNRCGQRLDWS